MIKARALPAADPLSGGPAARFFTEGELESTFTEAFRFALRSLTDHPRSAGTEFRGPGPVLILPPDLTRIHSRAGLLSAAACRELAASPRRAGGNWSLGGIMPALGTHRPLGPEETALMFPRCPADKFLPHLWRSDTVELGRLEAPWVEARFSAGPGGGPELPAGAFALDWPVQVNRALREGLNGRPFSLIVSIGQVVPHEVAGMANHGKNIFIGTGGEEGINKSHWLGALYGLERLMGRRENPVRSLFDEGLRRYGSLLPPIFWALTVIDRNGAVRGLFTGFGRECFERAAELSKRVNIEYLPKPVKKIVVWLDPKEYRSCWLGNKAIYRSRGALASGGELVILAPALERFGEDEELDRLIRSYGYRGAAAIQRAVAAGGEGGGLARSLCAAAHLIHGSSEGRFTVRYCTGGRGSLGREELEGAGFAWGDLEEESARCLPKNPVTGRHTSPDGEEYYFIENPGLGLWISQANSSPP